MYIYDNVIYICGHIASYMAYLYNYVIFFLMGMGFYTIYEWWVPHHLRSWEIESRIDLGL